ncbi:hypothetical protein B5X24_HaOG216639 [Helicoverpa armigera]|nr:hypothetical protein B5X24_HaOG216639 [Helicoverpa armigera]
MTKVIITIDLSGRERLGDWAGGGSGRGCGARPAQWQPDRRTERTPRRARTHTTRRRISRSVCSVNRRKIWIGSGLCPSPGDWA